MRIYSAVVAALLSCTAFVTPAQAQEADAAGAQQIEGVVSDPDGSVLTADNRGGAQVFALADFARFSPRNALDMLSQVPGFSIRDEGDQRGLGQASTNVLINGERVSSKSDGVFSRLQSISSDRVARIEIVDGATLGIAGLSGQVANVVTSPDPFSGRFRYRVGFRDKYAKPSYFGGELSLSGTKDAFEWSVTYNHGTGRGAAGGGIHTLSGPDGEVFENRDTRIQFNGEFPKLSGRTKWTSPGGTVVNANASYRRVYQDNVEDQLRSPLDDIDRASAFLSRVRGWNLELGGDVDFALGPGRLKLIGQDQYGYRNYRQDFTLDFLGAGPDDVGSRYAAQSDSGERIVRGEYNWAMLGGDWQFDAEAAFNRLDSTAQLYDLAPDGEYVEIPFPNGTGGVKEDRYEAILTHSRTLSEGLSLQFGGGAEYSTISQTGSRGLTRSFWRPKGSANIAWAAGSGLDVSLKLARTVGQLDFGDFLASVQLNEDNGNAGNIELVPPQSWDADLEMKKDLGRYGSSTLRLYGRWYEDFIEIVPVPGGLEATGNIDSARLYGANLTTTFELAPLGFKGAKIDTSFEYEDTSLEDPLTGKRRPFSGKRDIRAEAQLRHDIPRSDIAWGLGAEYFHAQPYYRLGEVSRDWEGPVYTYAYVEHKDVFGMTAEFSVFNLTGGKSYYERSIYDGYRDRSPLLLREYRKLDVGLIFNFSLSGDF